MKPRLLIPKLTYRTLLCKLIYKTSFCKCNASWFQECADLSKHMWEKKAKMKLRMGTFLWKNWFQQHTTFLRMISALEDIKNLQFATRFWILLFTFYPVLIQPFFFFFVLIRSPQQLLWTIKNLLLKCFLLFIGSHALVRVFFKLGRIWKCFTLKSSCFEAAHAIFQLSFGSPTWCVWPCCDS